MKFSQTGVGDDGDDVSIDLNDPCTLTFAVKYLNHFCKASSLSDRVTLSLSNDNPLGMLAMVTLYCMLSTTAVQ